MALFSRRFRVESLESRRLLASLADVPIDQASHDSNYAEIRSSPFAHFATGVDRSAEHVDQPRISADIDDVDIDEIAVSVAAENLLGARAVELRFEYASDSLDVDPASLSLGDAWRGRASLVQKVDDVAGTISVFIYSAQPMTMAAGELLHFDAEVSDARAFGQPEALLELVKFELNEGQLHSSPTVSLQVSQDAADDWQDGEDLRAHGASHRQGTPWESRAIAAGAPQQAAEHLRGGVIASEHQSSLSWQRIVSGSSTNNLAYPVQYIVHGLPKLQARDNAPVDLTSSDNEDWWLRWQSSTFERRRWGFIVDSIAATGQEPMRVQSTSAELTTVLHACLPWS